MVYTLRQPAYSVCFFLVKISIVLLYQYHFPFTGYHLLLNIFGKYKKRPSGIFKIIQNSHYRYFTDWRYPVTDLLFTISAITSFTGNNFWRYLFIGSISLLDESKQDPCCFLQGWAGVIAHKSYISTGSFIPICSNTNQAVKLLFISMKNIPAYREFVLSIYAPVFEFYLKDGWIKADTAVLQ